MKEVTPANESDESPSIDELRGIFAKNIDRLLDLLGTDRKQAAGKVGVPYKWLWRMATKGITRIDDRHRPNLQKLAEFFLVQSVNDFWQVGLLYRLISTEPLFRARFTESLRRLYQAEYLTRQSVDQRLLASLEPFSVITEIVEMNPQQPVMTTNDKYEWLIATGRYEHLRQMFEGFNGLVDREFEMECGKNKNTIRDAANF